MKLLSILTLCVFFISAGCGTDQIVDSFPGNPVVSGTVLVDHCSGWHNGQHVPLFNYALHTGKRAHVTMEREDGLTFTTVTDSLSRFRLPVDTGTYELMLETFHMFPRRAGRIHVLRDSSGIDLVSAFDISPTDSIRAILIYRSSTDTSVAVATAYQALLTLSKQMRGIVNIQTAHIRVLQVNNEVQVSFNQIALRSDWPSWKAELRADSIMAGHESLYPEGFGVMAYWATCPQDSVEVTPRQKAMGDGSRP